MSLSGSNTGIGKTTAIELARRGARVVLACRSRERGEAALADVRRVSPAESEFEARLTVAFIHPESRETALSMERR